MTYSNALLAPGRIPSDVVKAEKKHPAASFGHKFVQIFYFKCSFFCRVTLLLTGRSTTGLKTRVMSLFVHHLSVKCVSEVGARGRVLAANTVLSPAVCLTVVGTA